MLWKAIFVTIALAAAFGASAKETETEGGKSCVVPIGSRELYRFQWPLVHTANGELYTAKTNGERTRIEVQPSDKVLLSCGPNYFKHFFKKEIMNAQCDGATGNFTVNGKQWSAQDLSCDLRIMEEIITPVAGCESNEWTAVHFGYVDPIEKVTYVMGEACYDTAEGRTLFAHVMLGKDKSANILMKPAKNYLTSRRHPDGRYKIELFRGLQFDVIYERLRVELQTRHIPQLKMSNYIDDLLLSNVQYQPVKKLGWNYYVGFDDHTQLETLKSDIRRLSENMNLNIFVGSHGVQTFKGKNGAKTPLYLHPQRFPMPEVIWFAIKLQDNSKSIAIAVANNAGAGGNAVDVENNDLSHLCASSDCSQVSWLSANLRNDEAGSLVCCSVGDLRKNIQEMPIMGETKDLLI